jgi:GT2 family glycosyltransferase
VGQDGGEGRPSALTKPEISVAIVSYNTRDFLRRCLLTLAGSGTSRPLEIIVVDNDSGDGSPDMVRAEFPAVRLLANRENAGYSRAVNQAIRTAAGRYVLVLNPDIEVLPGSVDALARFLDENPSTGIAGGKLLNHDGTLQYSCRTFYTLPTLLHRRTPLGRLFPNSRIVREHLMMDWDHENAREVDWMLGACLMVRVEAITDVGLMDERFFMYFEDVDWCYRMKQHGWKVVYVPDARMKHLHRRESAGGGLFNQRLLAHLNSMFRFFDKWNTLLYRARRHRDLALGTLHLVGDVLAVNAAFVGAWALRALLRSVLARPVFPLESYGAFLLLTNGVVLLVNAMLGLYRRPSSRDLLDDAFEIGKGLVLSVLVLAASTFLTRSELHSRFMLAAFVPFAFGGMLLGRAVLHRVARALRRSRFDQIRVVVLGERVAAAEIARGLEARPELGYEIVATMADHPAREEERRFREFWDAEGIREVIRRHRVGEVLLVKPKLSDRELARLVLLCGRDGVRARLVSGIADVLPGHLAVSELLGRPVVDLGTLAGGGVARWRRRATDLGLAGVALFFLGPWAWVRAFRPVREAEPHETIHGLGGRTFRRRLGRGSGRRAETLGHVLRGDLALVGPRPVGAPEVAEREELRIVLDLVRPGATGPWRVHGREGLSAEEEVSLTLSYLQNQSPQKDLKLVLQTLARERNTPRSKRNDS